MASNLAYESSERLKKVLLQDKLSNPERLNEVLKEELLFVLSSYMDISPKNFKLYIGISEGGGFDVYVKAKAERIYSIKH